MHFAMMIGKDVDACVVARVGRPSESEWVPPAVINDLCGRPSESETNTLHTSPAGIERLKNVLEKLPTTTEEIVAREI